MYKFITNINIKEKNNYFTINIYKYINIKIYTNLTLVHSE